MFDATDHYQPPEYSASPEYPASPDAHSGPADPAAPNPPPYSSCGSDEALAEAMEQMAALESAVRLELIRMVAELAGREVWVADGQTGMLPWLCLRLGLRARSALEIIAVASRLHDLPAIMAAFGTGQLTWDQLVPLCELANPDTDRAWATDGPRRPAEELADLARHRRQRAAPPAEVHERRSVCLRPDPRGGTRLSGLLEASDAEALRVALDRRREADAVVDPTTQRYPTTAQQRADALAALAHQVLGADTDPARATIVLHADAALLTDDHADGQASLSDGTPVAAQTLRRLACDGHIHWAVDGPDGVTIGVGRSQRTWPAWLARLIRHRDGEHCRFPGCRRPIHHIHHSQHWHDHAGTTDSANGFGVCFTHHHHLHEGGWHSEGSANTELVFRGPDGRVLTSAPRRLDPRLRHRLGLPPPGRSAQA